MRAKAEVLHCFTCVLRATEQDDVGAGRRTQRQLVEGQALAASLLDARTGSRRETQSADAQLRHLIEAVVIRDGTDNGADLALVRLARVRVRGDSDDLGEGDGGPDRWSINSSMTPTKDSLFTCWCANSSSGGGPSC